MTTQFAEEVEWLCPYCDRTLADERSACCGEVGHAIQPAAEVSSVKRAPDMGRLSGSWIVSDANGNSVWETFKRETADRAARAGWIVETAADYLSRLNQRIRK